MLGRAFLMTSKVTYVTLSTDEGVGAEYEAALERLRHDLDGYYPVYIDGAEVQSEDGELA